MEVINRYNNKKTKEGKRLETKIRKKNKQRRNHLGKKNEKGVDVTQRCDLDRLDHLNWSETTSTNYLRVGNESPDNKTTSWAKGNENLEAISFTIFKVFCKKI